MTGLFIHILALTTSALADSVDTNRVDFPFVKHGPIAVYSLAEGVPDGGRDSLASLHGGGRHATDSLTYDKLIPLRLEAAEVTDSGTSYRVSYIGYRENPGFKYMWNSSTFRYARSHRLDYLTAPIPPENVARHVRMTKDLRVPAPLNGQLISTDFSLHRTHPIARLNLFEYYDGLWDDRFYLGSSMVSLAFMRDREATRISANGLAFLAASMTIIFQTEQGVYGPWFPGLFSPLGYGILLLHAVPNTGILIPVYGKALSLKAGMNTDYFPRSEQNRIAFALHGGVTAHFKRMQVFMGAQNQMHATVPEAEGLRYTVTFGIGGFETEMRPYFR